MRFPAAFLLAATVAGGCARNPATGRLQFNLISDAEEDALGAELDAEVRAGVGLYPSKELTDYVAGVGQHVARASERGSVTWTFRVLDDPSVNAFALPGGYVYVARGLLAHLQSEAELAATLGHEIGHVTAMHGATQYSRAQAAARGVGVLRVVDPNMRHIGALAAGGAQLRLLRHSREHELEADTLGLRYLRATGYPDTAIVDVLTLLASLPGDKPPAWLSTHPDPDYRVARLNRSGLVASDGVPDPEYLARLEGLTVGPDPRDGFLTANRWAHPRAGYAITLPVGWAIARDEGMLVGTSPDEKVIVVVAVSGHETPQEATRAFFGSGGLLAGDTDPMEVGGFAALTTPFMAADRDATLTGVASFVQVDEKVVMFVAFGEKQSWEAHAGDAAAAFASLGRPTATEQAVQPTRMHIMTLEQPTTLARMAGTEDPDTMAMLLRLNRVDADESLPAGRAVKLLRGGPQGS